MLLAADLFSFLTLLRPPRPTLFPYTTLFRSLRLPGGSPPARDSRRNSASPSGVARRSRCAPRWTGRARRRRRRTRSEEHTSELQSLTKLVCRLLLEKKKEERRAWAHTARDAP